MKTLLTLFVLFFSSSVVADDISDFQIEGMSVGDSLLNYFTHKEIINNLSTRTYNRKGGQKFIDINFDKNNFKTYDEIQIAVKKDDDNYKIYGIDGIISFNRSEDCFAKKTEIINDMSKVFPASEVLDREAVEHPDHSGTFTYDYFFFIDNDDVVGISCFILSSNLKQSGYNDQLRVFLWTEELDSWLSNT